MEYLLNKLPGALMVVGAMVTLATAVVAMTPSKKDDEVVSKIAKYWHKLRDLLTAFSVRKK